MATNTTPNNQSNSANVKEIDALGVIISEVSKQKLPPGVKYGLLVQQVNDNARLSGVNPGDLIVGIGNRPLNSFNDFVTIVK